MNWNEEWATTATCNQSQPDELFVRGAAQNRAKQLCAGCPVKTECLAEALDNQIEWGVWGGMTERERRALLRKRRQPRKAERLGPGGADAGAAAEGADQGKSLPDRRLSREPAFRIPGRRKSSTDRWTAPGLTSAMYNPALCS